MPIRSCCVYYTHGYRSVILKARGFENVINVEGGFAQLKEIDSIKKTEYVCPTTLL